MWLALLAGCAYDQKAAPVRFDSASASGSDSGDSNAADSSDSADSADTGFAAIPYPNCSVPVGLCDESACAFSGSIRWIPVSANFSVNGGPPSGGSELTFSPLGAPEHEPELRVDADFELVEVPAGWWALSWGSHGYVGAPITLDAAEFRDATSVSLSATTVRLSGPSPLWDGGAIEHDPDLHSDYDIYVSNDDGFSGSNSFSAGHDWALDVAPGRWSIWVRNLTLRGGSGSAFGATLAVEGDTTVVLDIPMVKVSGMIAIGGSGGGDPSNPDVVFETAGGERSWEVDVVDGAYSARIPAGTWGVSLRPWSNNSGHMYGTIPVVSAVVLETDEVLDLDLTLGLVSGALSLDGEPVPEGACSTIEAQDLETGEWLTVNCPGGPEYSMALPAGTYDIWLGLSELDSSFMGERPEGPYAVAESVHVAGDLELDLAATTVLVTGSILYDGEAPAAAAEYDDWRLVFTDRRGDRLVWGFEGGGEWSALLPTGTWSVAYVPGVSDIYGAGELLLATDFDPVAQPRFDIDVALIDVPVTVDLGAVPPIDSVRAVFSSETLGWMAEGWLSIDGDGMATGLVRVPPGTYTVYLHADEADDNLLSKEPLVAPCVLIEAPTPS